MITDLPNAMNLNPYRAVMPGPAISLGPRKRNPNHIPLPSGNLYTSRSKKGVPIPNPEVSCRANLDSDLLLIDKGVNRLELLVGWQLNELYPQNVTDRAMNIIAC